MITLVSQQSKYIKVWKRGTIEYKWSRVVLFQKNHVHNIQKIRTKKKPNIHAIRAFSTDDHSIQWFQKGIDPAAGSPTATLLRLHSSREPSPHTAFSTLTKSMESITFFREGYCSTGFQGKSSPRVWRAMCTRLRYKFTVPCWYTITGNSNFMKSSCRLQSELR